MECHMQTTQEHFAARIVSSIDASFFILGLHKHQSSRGVIFISTTFPGMDERRQLKKKEKLV
ncbi:uncharacterized protein RHIMIDRAFT_277238, partial [Rhizopus microsporus ATCC 52813]